MKEKIQITVKSFETQEEGTSYWTAYYDNYLPNLKGLIGGGDNEREAINELYGNTIFTLDTYKKLYFQEFNRQFGIQTPIAKWLKKQAKKWKKISKITFITQDKKKFTYSPNFPIHITEDLGYFYDDNGYLYYDLNNKETTKNQILELLERDYCEILEHLGVEK